MGLDIGGSIRAGCPICRQLPLALGHGSGGICGLACWAVHSLAREKTKWPKWLCMAEVLGTAVAAGSMAGWTRSVWPTAEHPSAVWFTLILLAAASTWNGANQASRVGGILIWLLALLYSGILAAGIKEIKLEWLIPQTGRGSWELAAAFLTPAAAVFLPGEKRGDMEPRARQHLEASCPVDSGNRAGGGGTGRGSVLRSS